MPKKVDLTGQRFGRLVVVRETDERNGGGSIVWECRCNCGNVKKVQGNHLRSGNIQSCGCLRRETSIENHRINVLARQEHNSEKEHIEGTNLSQLNDKKSKRNTSGIRGVSRDNQRQKWAAYMMFKGEAMKLGYYDNLEDAAKARKEAEEKYFTPILEKYGRLEGKTESCKTTTT